MIVVMFGGVLDSGQGELVSPEDLLCEVNLSPESTWMGIYIQGTRIGYVHSRLEPMESGGYEIEEFSRITGAMMGVQQVMRIRMSVIADSALALVEFDGLLDAEPYATSFSGHVRGKVLTVKVTTGGELIKRVFPAPEPIYLSQVIKPLLQAGKLKEGDSLKLSGFDPVSMQMQDLVVRAAGREERMFRGEKIRTRKLISRMSGLESTIWVDDDGNTLEERGPMGIVMRREEMEQALDISGSDGGVDFLSIYAIKPIGTIEGSRKVRRVRYRITNVLLQDIAAASDRQRWIDEENGIIEVSTVSHPSDPGKTDTSAYTGDAPFIESRDPQIRQVAAEAMRDGTGRLDSLNRLSIWVYGAVKKKPSAGIPSALAVLKMRQGDCNEHSVLFTAMARSMGIPARLQLGVVYQHGKFYYHAWPAAWVDDRWIEFEPTFGLETVDAARIALTAGDLSSALELVGAIGRIKIEILEAE